MTARWRGFLGGVHARVSAIVGLQIVAVTFLVLFIARQPGPGQFQLYDLVSAQTLATTVRALEASDARARATLIPALAASGTAVTIERGFPATARAVRPSDARYASYRALLGGREWRVDPADGSLWLSLGGGRVISTAPVGFLVRIHPHEIVTIRRIGAPILPRLGMLVLGVAIFAALSILLFTRQITRPVRHMARALQTAPGGLAGADMPVTGAREFRELAHAFNQMRRTLRELVDDRTRVLGAIAHDLRTYLTRLELRADHIADPRQRALAMADLGEMSVVLKDTLTFASAVADPGEPQAGPIDIAPILRSAIEGRVSTGQNVTLHIAGDTPLPSRISVVGIHRILGNLIDNAVRYGGCAQVHARRDAGWTVIRVEDGGPGVPEAVLSELRKPFFRVESSRGRDLGGSGLGLAIVDALARQHGGALELANGTHGGFSATIRLPAG